MQKPVFPGLGSGELVNGDGLYAPTVYILYPTPTPRGFKKYTVTKILLKQNAPLKIHQNIQPSFCKLVKMFIVESVL